MPWSNYGTGWWFQPLWKIWKSVGMMTFPIIWEKHVPNHQPGFSWIMVVPESSSIPIFLVSQLGRWLASAKSPGSWIQNKSSIPKYHQSILNYVMLNYIMVLSFQKTNHVKCYIIQTNIKHPNNLILYQIWSKTWKHLEFMLFESLPLHPEHSPGRPNSLSSRLATTGRTPHEEGIGVTARLPLGFNDGGFHQKPLGMWI